MAELKQTAAGAIPSDWEVPKLHLVLRSGRLGGNYRNGSRETDAPLMKMGNLDRGIFDLDKVEFVQEAVAIDQAHRLRKGDVLFNTRNTLDLVGKVAIWRNELPVAYFNSNLMRLEFNRRLVHSNRFANYLLNSAAYISLLRALATGTTSVAAIYTRDLLQLPFVCPPASEQRAIATVLSDVDELLIALDQLIAKKRDLKQAAMQQLLTGRKRLIGFSDPWREQAIGELAEIVSGATPRTGVRDYWDGGIPWCTPTDITASAAKFLKVTDRTLTEAGLAACSAQLLPAGAILLCTRATVGEVKIAAMPVCTNQGFKSLVCKGHVHNEYLYYQLLTLKPRMLAKASGSTFPELSNAETAALRLPVPPIDEQRAIAQVLGDMDDELVALDARLNKTRQLKQGMMQALLTGRIRLK